MPRVQVVIPGGLSPKGYQQITDMSASTALTVPKGAEYALVQAETADVRWRDDGTAPTSSVGMLLDVSAMPEGIWIEGKDRIEAFRVIETATTAVLNVSYYAKPGQ
jgi:hypothetical protein